MRRTIITDPDRKCSRKERFAFINFLERMVTIMKDFIQQNRNRRTSG